MIITLSWYELWMASGIGAKRHIESLKGGDSDQHGCDGMNAWTMHIEGAAGEMAAAKAMGTYYSGSINTYRTGGDVGAIQVRTRSRPEYDLLIRPGDRDGDVFVLVTGRSPDLDVRGWILAKDAKRACWLKAYGGRPPAYFVPQDQLNPISSLIAAATEALQQSKERLEKIA